MMSLPEDLEEDRVVPFEGPIGGGIDKDRVQGLLPEIRLYFWKGRSVPSKYLLVLPAPCPCRVALIVKPAFRRFFWRNIPPPEDEAQGC